MLRFPFMKEIIPEACSGDYSIKHFTVSEEQASQTRELCQFSPLDKEVFAGDFCKLSFKVLPLMTDSGRERASNQEFVDRARGDILIAGLGLGMIVCPVAAKADSITIVEISQDVYNLTFPYVAEYIDGNRDKVKFVLADIHEFVPDRNYDVIYFDIWGHYSYNTFDEAEQLRDKFMPYLKEGGWMGSWNYEHMKELHSLVANARREHG